MTESIDGLILQVERERDLERCEKLLQLAKEGVADFAVLLRKIEELKQ